MNASLAKAADRLRYAERILVFTGAGVSVESGIPTFRDDGGFWTEFPPETYATWASLMKVAAARPKELARFLHAVVAPVAQARPNAAHLAIAQAEAHRPITVVTQNIDGLHQAAGSTVVHEIHGTLLETMTESGRFDAILSRQDLQRVADSLDRASQGALTLARILLAIRPMAGVGRLGIYRPKVVLFNDAMAEPAWSKAQEAAQTADCVVQIGCSGQVYPAATIPSAARRNGATVISIDPNAASGDFHLRGKASELVPKLFELAFRDL
jgi:NAD-dependent deacetylase